MKVMLPLRGFQQVTGTMGTIAGFAVVRPDHDFGASCSVYRETSLPHRRIYEVERCA